MPSVIPASITQIYLRWVFLRAVFHRGWWLVASLYLVTEAELNALELVLLGTGQGLVVLLCEIPTGLVADAFSRKWSLIISHILMGLGMLMTGLVTNFYGLLLTQMLWGLSWTFASGADVAWVTDELNQPDKIDRVLGRAATHSQTGAAVGLLVFGTLAQYTSLASAVVSAGAMMLLLGIYVLRGFQEQRFQPLRKPALIKLRNTLTQGITLIRLERIFLLVFIVTFFVNGADEAFSRLYAKALIELGLPHRLAPTAWLTILGLVTLSVGAVTLATIERWLSETVTLRRLYITGCLIGTLGILMFALAPDYRIALLGVLLVHGVAWNILRVVGVVWVNKQATSPTRSTMQSFLSLAENVGEVLIGVVLAHIAHRLGIADGFIAASVATLLAGLLILVVKNNAGGGPRHKKP